MRGWQKSPFLIRCFIKRQRRLIAFYNVHSYIAACPPFIQLRDRGYDDTPCALLILLTVQHHPRLCNCLRHNVKRQFQFQTEMGYLFSRKTEEEKVELKLKKKKRKKDGITRNSAFFALSLIFYRMYVMNTLRSTMPCNPHELPLSGWIARVGISFDS